MECKDAYLCQMSSHLLLPLGGIFHAACDPIFNEANHFVPKCLILGRSLVHTLYAVFKAEDYIRGREVNFTEAKRQNTGRKKKLFCRLFV